MACMVPMVAGRVPGLTKNGKQRFKFLKRATEWFGPAPVNGMLAPCRQCVMCRLRKSSEWATRIMHETKNWSSCSFVTLTYDDNRLPENGTLNKAHFRAFRNDLRGRFDYYGLGKLKFFGVGEYGKKTRRPHYHAIVFGSDFKSGSVEEAPSRTGGAQWSSSLISEVWKCGIHRVSVVNFESAAYVARYSLKKISRDDSFFTEGRIPEFQSISNGIGRGWLEQWKEDWAPRNKINIPGRGDLPIPEYYMRKLEVLDPGLFLWLKDRRKGFDVPTADEWLKGVSDRYREGTVKQVVTDDFLKRGL